MEIEELVPPLELCKLIPKGEFEDSALLWCAIDIDHKFLVFRHSDFYKKYKDVMLFVKAPILEEIMQKLRQNYIKVGAFVGDIWGCCVINTFSDEIAELDSNSPATAALKLLLKLKGIKYE